MLAPSMSTEGNIRFVRWQGRSIAQLGFVNNTVLGLTTASLGFAVSRQSSGWTQCALWVGIGFLLTSVWFALCCARNRLLDFRESAQLARRRLDAAERRERRRKNRKRGECTWALLNLQLLTFALGATLVVVGAVPWSKVTEARDAVPGQDSSRVDDGLPDCGTGNDALESVVNPPCWASETAVRLNLTIP